MGRDGELAIRGEIEVPDRTLAILFVRVKLPDLLDGDGSRNLGNGRRSELLAPAGRSGFRRWCRCLPGAGGGVRPSVLATVLSRNRPEHIGIESKGPPGHDIGDVDVARLDGHSHIAVADNHPDPRRLDVQFRAWRRRGRLPQQALPLCSSGAIPD